LLPLYAAGTPLSNWPHIPLAPCEAVTGIGPDGKDYVEGTFTVGDLMMADVLRIVDHTELLGTYSHLSA
jgi:hypothetical protein